jgi:inosine-uridine nucleoside N-ribohydrolase
MVRFILDTDLGGDSDDAGALALSHNLMKLGHAELLAVTSDSSACYSPVTIKWINEFFGRGDIPVGINRSRAFMERDEQNLYSKPLAEEYLSTHPMPEFDSSLNILRRTVAANRDIRIVTIGALNNLCDLLRSGPDEISPLTGEELVRRNAGCVYVMGGQFTDPGYAEYNITCDTDSARYVSEHCPVPIVYSGFEFGQNIYTGINFGRENKTNPMYKAYSLVAEAFRLGSPTRDSWGPITVYAAVFDGTDTGNIEKVSGLRIRFDGEGRAVVTEGGKDSYLRLMCSRQHMTELLDGYMHI